MIGQILGFSIYATIAFALAITVALSFGMALHARTIIRIDLMPSLFFIILFTIMASPIVEGRVLTAGSTAVEIGSEDLATSFWFARIATLGVLFLCFEHILRYSMHPTAEKVKNWGLPLAFLIYVISNQILNGMFGANPSFDHKVLYSIIAYFAMFLSIQKGADHSLRLARTALLIFLAGSAFTAIVMPSMVMEQAYSAGLSALRIRYYGLAAHANTMGPLVIAFMILLWRYPIALRSVNATAWLLAGVSLFLTQSKTSWAIAIVIWMILFLYRYRAHFLKKSPGRRSDFSIIIIALACFITAAIIIFFYFGGSILEPLFQKLDSANGGQISSLTGRTRIWAIAWYEFVSHPVFGYGPSIWGEKYRFDVGMSFANHAHNQFLQAFSSAGIVGGIGVSIYMIVLLIYAKRAMALSHGISLALVALLLLRTFAEVPLSISQIMQSEFLIQLLALTTCVGHSPSTSVKTKFVYQKTT